MAKSKHATALFEVMARQRAMSSRGGSVVTILPPDKNGAPASSSSSPKWWFKSRTAPEAKAAAPSDAGTATAVESSEWAPRVEAAIPAPAPEPAPAPMRESLADPTMPAAPRVQPVAMEVDPDKQQISLRLSYTSALIGGFGVFIVLGLAVLIGKGLSRGPAPALANTSTAQLRKAPPTPGVMHLTKRATPASAKETPYEMPEIAGAGARPVGAVSTGTKVTAPQQSFNEPRPPATFFTDDPHRINGLNYAVIQSYPAKEKEMADQAAAFLTGNGIPCTVERDLPGWRTTWKDGYILVGIRGFDKPKNNAALETYKKQIMQVSSKFTNGRSGFKSFDPTMYQWKKNN
jgi:hypothetical protein